MATPATSARLSAAIVSRALSPSALLCLLPGVRTDEWAPGQDVHLPPAGGNGACPCCWKIDELQRGAGSGTVSGGAEAAMAEAKMLGKARKYAGCRIWRRFA